MSHRPAPIPPARHTEPLKAYSVGVAIATMAAAAFPIGDGDQPARALAVPA
jgi:hypothetical protein